MATKNLEEIKDKLYKAFDKALAHYEEITSYSSGNTVEKVSARSLALGAAAQTAQAISSVEREIAVLDWIKECRERGDNIAAEMDKGLAKGIVPLSTIKLKPPGG